MQWEQVERHWTQVKESVQSKWGKLTDDDLVSVSAKKDVLVGRIQERYGILKQHAEKQVDLWLDKLKPHDRVDDPAPSVSTVASGAD